MCSSDLHESPALLLDVIANGALQHRVASLKGIKNRPLRDLTLHFEVYLAADLRQRSQMRRQHDPNAPTHASVWTSTESTAGRSRTIGFQESPASADA